MTKVFKNYIENDKNNELINLLKIYNLDYKLLDITFKINKLDIYKINNQLKKIKFII